MMRQPGDIDGIAKLVELAKIRDLVPKPGALPLGILANPDRCAAHCLLNCHAAIDKLENFAQSMGFGDWQ